MAAAEFGGFRPARDSLSISKIQKRGEVLKDIEGMRVANQLMVEEQEEHEQRLPVIRKDARQILHVQDYNASLSEL